VGIGTSSPSYKLDMFGTNCSLQVRDNGQTNGLLLKQNNSDGGNLIYATNNNYLALGTNNTERMRIDSSGNVLIGYTSLPTNLGILNVNGNIAWGNQSGNGRIYSDVNWGCIFQASKASPNAHVFLFEDASNNGLMTLDSALGTGTVYSNGGTLTNTNPSDATLKTNIQDLSLGLNFINQLRPVSFNWIDNRVKQGIQYGFIAQEVQKIEPSIITEFEYIDSNDINNIQKSIKLGLEEKAINTALVKAIQEQQTLITTLQTQVTQQHSTITKSLLHFD
jgi:hypothetical protein